MKIKTVLAIISALPVLQAATYGAAITSVNLDATGDVKIANSNGTTLLTGGTYALDNDGAVLQLGYFSSATVANNFNGTWVALTGEGSLNTAFNNTTFGDTNGSFPFNDTGDGQFSLTVNFELGSGTSGNSLPTAGTPLAIRFYNSTSVAGATFFETISNDLWLWQAPLNPPFSPSIDLYISDSGGELQSGGPAPVSGNIATTIPVVPEPTSIALMMLGLVSLTTRRRRPAK